MLGTDRRQVRGTGDQASLRRRLSFAMLVVISQILLIAVTVAWLVHMGLIAVNGSVFFVEENPAILWGEIGATVLIIMFAGQVLILQIRRLGERRVGDRERRER